MDVRHFREDDSDFDDRIEHDDCFAVEVTEETEPIKEDDSYYRSIEEY